MALSHQLRTSVLTIVCVLATVAATPTGEIPRPRKLGKTHTIKKYGYKIRVPKSWKSAPSKPGEHREVGGWTPDMKEINKRGDYGSLGCELSIVRMPVKGSTTGAGTDTEKKERPGSITVRNGRVRFSKKVKTMHDYIENAYDGASKRYVKKAVRTKARGKKKLIGSLMEFTSRASFITIAVFQKNGWDWAIIYEAPEAHYKKEWRSVYLKSIKSFEVFTVKDSDKPASFAPGFDSSKLTPEQRRKQIKAGIAGNPGWYAVDTKNYVFLSNSKQKGLLKSLAREIEVIRSKVYEKLFPPQKKITNICIARVFSDQGEYHQYGGPRGSAGYWNAEKEELVLFDKFDGVTKKNSKAFTRAVMYHEAFHQYIHYAVGDLAPHSWFNEGHGDFFAGMVVSGRKVSFRPFSWRMDYLKRHFREGKSLIPIRSLVRLPQHEYYSNAGLKYSQGWALVYYLRRVTKNKHWQGIPDRYFNHLQKNIAAFKKEKAEKDDASGESIPGIPGVKIFNFSDQEKVEKILEEAVDKGFEGVDYEALDKAFNRWINGKV